jgi:hypothetical protein
MTTALHFVECSFGKLGNAFVERDTADMDRKATLADFVSGQFDKPLRVLEVIPDEGTARDVSEDFARSLAALRVPLTAAVIDFIEQHAGIRLALQMDAA